MPPGEWQDMKKEGIIGHGRDWGQEKGTGSFEIEEIRDKTIENNIGHGRTGN